MIAKTTGKKHRIINDFNGRQKERSQEKDIKEDPDDDAFFLFSSQIRNKVRTSNGKLGRCYQFLKEIIILTRETRNNQNKEEEDMIFGQSDILNTRCDVIFGTFPSVNCPVSTDIESLVFLKSPL